MTFPLRALRIPLWRMISVPRQRDPFSGEGARLYGGRWNMKGWPALYLATDHATAVAEFYRGRPKPGTLAPYSVSASRIADLTDGRGEPADADVAEAMAAEWKAIALLDGRVPPSWALVQPLIATGAEGALVPSVQNRGGTNLVLWRWREADGDGEGAALTLLDPTGDLRAGGREGSA